MNVRLVYTMAALLMLPYFACQAAPAYNGYNYNTNNPSNSYRNNYQPPSPPRPAEDPQSRQIRMVAEFKNELNNHETEIRTLESRLNNQEAILENVRQQLTETVQTQHDLSQAQTVNLEGKVDSLDGIVKGLIADIRLMKNQANDSVAILAQYKQKMGELERLIESQNQHMKNLEVALNSIMEVLQAKEAVEIASSKTSNGSPKTYKVQSGDSLEKIARMHKVSVQALRDLNKLNQDRIVIGQTLKIP